MNRQISIIGRGIDPFRHLTLAGLRALRAADKVIGIEPETASWEELRREFNLPAIEDVSCLYRSDAVDLDNYDRYLRTILELSAKFPKLVVLVAGHPRLGVTFLQKLPLKLPPGTSLDVVEGISSFDVLLNDLALDPIERGTSLLDVNRMLLFKYELEPSVSYFFYHVCSVANSVTNYANPLYNDRLEILANYLLRFYPPEKTIYLCRGSHGENDPSARDALSIAELSQAASRIDFATTLYIPPENPKRLDRNILSLLQEQSC